MKDNFDDGMVLPDEEMTGGSALSDIGAGSESEAELDLEGLKPTGRPSGGVRARSSSGSRKAAGGSRKTAPKRAAGARKGAKKKSAGSKKKAGARKAGARKAARRSKPSRKAVRKAGKKKKAGRRR